MTLAVGYAAQDNWPRKPPLTVAETLAFDDGKGFYVFESQRLRREARPRFFALNRDVALSAKSIPAAARDDFPSSRSLCKDGGQRAHLQW